MLQIASALVIVFTSAVLAVAGEGKIVLFDGKSLDGWVAEGANEFKKGPDGKVIPVWTVENNLILCRGKGFGFLRYARQEFSDFHFHVEYRMAKKCNSGIGIRTVPFDPKRSVATRPSYACYEIQLLDDAGKPPTAHSSGSLYRYVAPTANPVKPAPEWNVLDIECVGSLIKISINGQKIIDVDQARDERIRKNPLKGYLCLQNHGGQIEFRHLWVQELKAARN